MLLSFAEVCWNKGKKQIKQEKELFGGFRLPLFAGNFSPQLKWLQNYAIREVAAFNCNCFTTIIIVRFLDGICIAESSGKEGFTEFFLLIGRANEIQFGLGLIEGCLGGDDKNCDCN